MKILQIKIVAIIVITFLFTSCWLSNSKDSTALLPSSSGSNNKVLTVIKASYWDGEIGNEIRKVFGDHQVGLPQRETLVSMSQVPTSSFNKTTNTNRSILHISIGDKDTVSISTNKYSKPQTIVYIKAKTEEKLKSLIASKAKEIIKIFKEQDLAITLKKITNNKLDETKFKTISDLGISIAVPRSYRLVKDSIGFLWLRQKLNASKKKLNGSNNIIVYSLPFANANLPDSIVKIRDEIGKKHLKGVEGTYMITETGISPAIFDSEIAGKKAYETRGLWFMKDDFMGGPFINYAIRDESKKRYIVFEGFIYMPSFNKRDLIFELETIGKSIRLSDFLVKN